MSAYVAHSSPTLCLRQDHTPRYHDKLKNTVISPPACNYIDHTAESLIYKDFQGKNEALPRGKKGKIVLAGKWY